MHYKLVSTAPRIFVIVFDPGNEVIKGLEEFCKETEVNVASLTAIGAFSNSVIGYFELKAKNYKNIPVNEQVEVLSFIGDIISYKDEPKLHAHVVLGRSDGTTRGGHLLSATVNPTLEMVATELPHHLHRELNEEFGIPLIRL
jgi:predicted DNA-binding protein with PD1-like motif